MIDDSFVNMKYEEQESSSKKKTQPKRTHVNREYISESQGWKKLKDTTTTITQSNNKIKKDKSIVIFHA